MRVQYFFLCFHDLFSVFEQQCNFSISMIKSCYICGVYGIFTWKIWSRCNRSFAIELSGMWLAPKNLSWCRKSWYVKQHWTLLLVGTFGYNLVWTENIPEVSGGQGALLLVGSFSSPSKLLKVYYFYTVLWKILDWGLNWTWWYPQIWFMDDSAIKSLTGQLKKCHKSPKLSSGMRCSCFAPRLFKGQKSCHI